MDCRQLEVCSTYCLHVNNADYLLGNTSRLLEIRQQRRLASRLMLPENNCFPQLKMLTPLPPSPAAQHMHQSPLTSRSRPMLLRTLSLTRGPSLVRLSSLIFNIGGSLTLETDLKNYLDSYGFKVPQGSTKNQLVAYARNQRNWFQYGTTTPQGTLWVKL